MRIKTAEHTCKNTYCILKNKRGASDEESVAGVPAEFCIVEGGYG
jgi:hypothetical protein